VVAMMSFLFGVGGDKNDDGVSIVVCVIVVS